MADFTTVGAVLKPIGGRSHLGLPLCLTTCDRSLPARSPSLEGVSLADRAINLGSGFGFRSSEDAG